MRNPVLLAVVGLLVICSIVFARDAREPTYALTTRWNIGLTVDAPGRRLFATRGNRVIVLDLTGKTLGKVGPTEGVHGVALAPALGKGYVSNGKGNAVTVFDLKTLATTATIAIKGENPDSIVFDPPTNRVFTFNGRSHDATVIDAKSGQIIATIPLGGKPEFAVSNSRGRIFVNIEDLAELDAIDTMTAKVVATWPLTGCEEPSGLALDSVQARLFSVCQNGQFAVTDARTGRHVASVPIGKGPDAVTFDPLLHIVFRSNGEDGTLTVIRQQSADRYSVLANVTTQRSARTQALDPQSHRVFMVAAEFEPLPAQHAPHQRRAMKAGTFSVLVVDPTDGR